jgi:pyrimidine deaminase RibD-like protein
MLEFRLTRRQMMARAIGLAGGALALARPAPASAATPAADRARLMARAVELRRIAVERGDQAFGAVVARDGQIVGEGISAVLTTPDPTAHGEVQAIRDAARRLGTPRLAGCELYTTVSPLSHVRGGRPLGGDRARLSRRDDDGRGRATAIPLLRRQ